MGVPRALARDWKLRRVSNMSLAIKRQYNSCRNELNNLVGPGVLVSEVNGPEIDLVYEG